SQGQEAAAAGGGISQGRVRGEGQLCGGAGHHRGRRRREGDRDLALWRRAEGFRQIGRGGQRTDRGVQEDRAEAGVSARYGKFRWMAGQGPLTRRCASTSPARER